MTELLLEFAATLVGATLGSLAGTGIWAYWRARQMRKAAEAVAARTRALFEKAREIRDEHLARGEVGVVVVDHSAQTATWVPEPIIGPEGRA